MHINRDVKCHDVCRAQKIGREVSKKSLAHLVFFNFCVVVVALVVPTAIGKDGYKHFHMETETAPLVEENENPSG